MDKTYDFGGWATRNNLKCSDGRIIMKDAFKHDDGQTVPLVWNHRHNDPFNVLGHAQLENRDEGVYAYCTFNDTEQGKNAKMLVQHGDVVSLSICANQLKQKGSEVMHGVIREVSLVLAGANPGAFIDSVMVHGEESDEEAFIYTGEESLSLYHSDDKKEDPMNKENEKEKSKDKPEDEETVKDVYDTLNEKQKTVVNALIGMALEDSGKVDDDKDDEEDKEMKHNIFDRDDQENPNFLSHAAEEEIIALAKTKGVGSLQDAIKYYIEEHKDTLSHGFESIEQLFPDYKDVYPGAPELLTRDQTWVSAVMTKMHKSPISRVRTRQIDARDKGLRALGYKTKGSKKNMANVKLLSRTTDPQTVYVKDKLERDDIIDITDFNVVEYQFNIMRKLLNEEIALAVMVGDGRDDGDEGKISEEHIRSIWHDDDLYTIHADVDIEKAKEELQGTGTGANFGENYIYAEAIITAALYAREDYKGGGSLDFFCTPHLLNVMLLARDMNGRRIYDSKSDLAAALNVGEIYTVEQFEGLERTDKNQKKHKLLGIFVNLDDYHAGSAKGGEITTFDDFDIDFNQYKYLMETRLSGALTRVYSAIALEEPVAGE